MQLQQLKQELRRCEKKGVGLGEFALADGGLTLKPNKCETIIKLPGTSVFFTQTNDFFSVFFLLYVCIFFCEADTAF